MTTSAQALNEILTHVSTRSNQELSFLSAVAMHLGLEGEHAKFGALERLDLLCKTIDADIDSLPLGANEKTQLSRYFAQFNGIKNYSQVHLTIRNARSNFLKPDHLLGLMNIHMALSGHCRLLELDDNAKEIAGAYRELAEKVSLSNLPHRAKRVFVKRSIQIATAIDHFNIGGSEALEEELEALLGAIALHNVESLDEEEKGLFKQAFGLFKSGLELLRLADKSLEVSNSLVENGGALIDKLPDL